MVVEGVVVVVVVVKLAIAVDTFFEFFLVDSPDALLRDGRVN